MIDSIPSKNPEPMSDISGDEDSASGVPPSKNAVSNKKSPKHNNNAEQEPVEDLSFPERLMSILQSGTVDHAMKWVANGEAVAIMTKVFEKVVLDGHFQGSKYSSFTRKLNRWGFKRFSTGTSMPQGWVAFRHGLFLRSRPELASKMCTGKNRHFVLLTESNKAKAAKTGGEQGTNHHGAPRHAAAVAAAGQLPVQKSSPQMNHSALSDNNLKMAQLIKMQLDEAIYMERMKLQQRFSDAAAAARAVRLPGQEREFLLAAINTMAPPALMMDTTCNTSRFTALEAVAAAQRRASGMSSAAGVAPRLVSSGSLCSVSQLHAEHDTLLGSRTRLLDGHRLLALQSRETQLRQHLFQQNKGAALLLNKQSCTGTAVGAAAGGSSSSLVSLGHQTGRPVITEAERQRLMRLREQLDFVIGNK